MVIKMMELVRIAVASLRKKNSIFSYSILILFAVMLLETGIFLLLSVPKYCKESSERLNAPDYAARMNDNMYQSSYLTFMQENEKVEEAEAISVIIMNNANYRTEKGKMILYANLFNLSNTGEMFQMHPLYEDTTIPAKEAIYVPLAFYQQGYRTGDPVSFEFQKSIYDFTIAGFFETAWFGSSSSPLYNYYLYPETFERIFNEIGGGKMLNIHVKDGYSVEEVREEFKTVTGVEFDAYSMDAFTMEFTADQVLSANFIMVMIISALSLLVSMMLMAIVLIVIWFRISNQIQENLKQIGVMQALGYSTLQIRMTIVLEHFFASVPGGILGVVCAYGFLALLGNVISGSLGILYKSSLHLATDALGLCIVLGIILGVSYLAARKVNKLSPVDAFRQGKKSHVFKKAPFALDKGNGLVKGLHSKLSLKSVCYAPRTYITLAVVLVGVSMILTFSVILYQNLGKDEFGFIRLMGSESCDVMVNLLGHTNLLEIREELEAMPEVTQTTLFESSTMEVEDLVISMNICDNYNKLKTYETYDGSFPENDNEVVLSGVVAKQLEKKIGDIVEITRNGVTAEYIICGLMQSMNNFGMQGALNFNGIKRVEPSYEFSSIYVYLAQGETYETFVKKIDEKYPMSELDRELSDIMEMHGIDGIQYALMVDGKLIKSGDSSQFKIDEVQDMKNMVLTATASYMVMVQTLSVFLILLSAVVTALILHLMVKSSINKRKQEFGILKAMGYSSKALMFQIAVAYLPISVPGVLVGCLLGSVFTGPAVTAITGVLGVSDISFQVSASSIFMMGCAILMFLFLNAWIVARRVKKVSVYELFTE